MISRARSGSLDWPRMTCTNPVVQAARTTTPRDVPRRVQVPHSPDRSARRVRPSGTRCSPVQDRCDRRSPHATRSGCFRRPARDESATTSWNRLTRPATCGGRPSVQSGMSSRDSRRPRDVREDLPSSESIPSPRRALESQILQMAEQRMHGGRPGATRPTHRPSDRARTGRTPDDTTSASSTSSYARRRRADLPGSSVMPLSSASLSYQVTQEEPSDR